MQQVQHITETPFCVKSYRRISNKVVYNTELRTLFGNVMSCLLGCFI